MQNPLKILPSGFDSFTDALLNEADTVEGFLSSKEMRFLTLLAACPTTEGEILEIGSFKGKSTIILAKASEIAGDEKVNAVDPMTAPSWTDPDLRGDTNSFDDFQRNITRHGVADRVRLHKTFSFDLAKKWNTPLRLLWIDGDHTYKGTKLDFEGFAPHLADRGIVAIHDVLHEFEGGARVFLENVLLSPNFGPCGFCGSIAWAQFLADSEEALNYTSLKLSLYRKLSRLVPLIAFDLQLKGFSKKKYKIFRAMIPHAAVDPQRWLATIR